MKYLVEFETGVEKDISKLGASLSNNIFAKIRELAHNPKKGKHLFSNFWELKATNYRVYYAIFRGIIVVEKVSYEGKVRIK